MEKLKEQPLRKRKLAIYFAVFMAVLIIGLYYVKWSPYFTKAVNAKTTHTIGDAIIANVGSKTPAFSITAGWTFTQAYFSSVWKAMLLGIIVGSLVQVLIPTSWIRKYLGESKFKNSVFAMVLGVPTMMCTCCTAPVAVGLKRAKASLNSIVAFFLANPLLNPATLVFMGFVLGWRFTFFRILFGIVTVLITATIVSKFSKTKEVNLPDNEIFDPTAESGSNLLVRWLKALVKLIVESIPAYIIIVFLLGSLQGLLFPAINNGNLNSGVLAILLFSFVGLLFVIPTAGEIPIIQVLMGLGLTSGPAAALLITLPAVSIVSLGILKPAFSWKNLITIGGCVLVMGILAGICGSFIL